jgi:hypothetical protein
MAVTARLDRCFNLAKNFAFQQRVAVAILDMVATVANEPPATVNHTNRLAFAAQVAYQPTPWADKMCLGIIVVSSQIQAGITSDNPDTNNAAVTDAQITTAVGSVWNFYADAAAALSPTTVKVF